MRDPRTGADKGDLHPHTLTRRPRPRSPELSDCLYKRGGKVYYEYVMAEEKKENSVVFNLRELMSLEDDRVQQEEEERLRREAEDRHRIEAEMQRKQEEEERQRQAAEQARLSAEQQKRQEEERLVREREQAELRVRLEHDAKRQAEEQARLLQHKRELAAIHAEGRKGLTVRVVSIGTGLALCLSAVAYFGVYKPRLERQQEKARVAQVEKERVAREADVARLEAEQAKAEADKAEREKELLARQAERQRQIAQEARDQNRRQSQPSGRRGSSGSRPAKADTDDPLAGLDTL